MEKGFYTIEPHGDRYALYAGRDSEHHGSRLCNLSDFDMHKDNTISMIEYGLNKLPKLAEENDELRAKLERVKGIALGIVNPVLALQKEAHQSGCELDGGVAIKLSNDPYYYKELGAKIIKECE